MHIPIVNFRLSIHILICRIMTLKPICLIDPERKKCRQSRQERERPPRDDDIPLTHTERERRAGDSRAQSTSQGANARGDSVQSAQDAQAGGGVGEKDDAAGEAEDAGRQFGKHEGEHAEVTNGFRGKHTEWGYQVDDRENEVDDSGAAENAELFGNPWEEKELDDDADDADCGIKEPDLLGSCISILVSMVNLGPMVSYLPMPNPPANLNGKCTCGLPSVSCSEECRNTGSSESNAMVCIDKVAWANSTMVDCGEKTSRQLGRLRFGFLRSRPRSSPSKGSVASSWSLEPADPLRDVQGRVSSCPSIRP